MRGGRGARRAPAPLGCLGGCAVTSAVARTKVTVRPKPWLNIALGYVGRPVVRLILDRRVRGSEHVPAAGPVLLAGNHRGLVDGPVVAAGLRRPVVFLAKAELFVGPLATLLGWLGQIPVHRGRPDRA